MRLKNTFPVADLDMPGTDADYQEWVRTLPSCIDGNFSEYVNGEGRNPSCHVRRAATFGTGYKAPFSSVPMTQEQHMHQSVSGEAACLNLFHAHRTDFTNEEAKRWFDLQLDSYRKLWRRRFR